MEETFTTPAGKTLVVRQSITARQRNEVRSITLLNGNEKTPTGEVLEKVEKKSVEVAVVSYDGTNENVCDRLLDSSPEEYDFVIEKAAGVVQGSFTKAK